MLKRLAMKTLVMLSLNPQMWLLGEMKRWRRSRDLSSLSDTCRGGPCEWMQWLERVYGLLKVDGLEWRIVDVSSVRRVAYDRDVYSSLAKIQAYI